MWNNPGSAKPSLNEGKFEIQMRLRPFQEHSNVHSPIHTHYNVILSDSERARISMMWGKLSSWRQGSIWTIFVVTEIEEFHWAIIFE